MIHLVSAFVMGQRWIPGKWDSGSVRAWQKNIVSVVFGVFSLRHLGTIHAFLPDELRNWGQPCYITKKIFFPNVFWNIT